ncbi:hypothetical protein B0H16DRAFT_1494420 [Mycena metata]|uniref:F-box domain-containing protein n=1 Tax=Mycena metata TaxID=1033252 RepID=A0AAD7P0L5_9AGAR|nr:hypothetical protein B0H16DRAFT_1494420 [Mycena metata]
MASLISLSPEIHLAITSHLPLSDRRCLRLVSQLFNNLLVLDVPVADLEAAAKEKKIFLVEKAIHAVEGGSPTLSVDIYYPKFMRNDDEDDDHEEGEWEIHIDMHRLSLSSSETLSPDSLRFTNSVDCDKLLRGKLLVASASLFRTRFECPECGNGRQVCPGCGGFSGRFSDLFCSCGWPMPCPVCIGYGVAYDAKYIQDDEEELDKLWKEIDEMTAQDKKACAGKN